MEHSPGIHFIGENNWRSPFDAAGKDIKHQSLRDQSTDKRKEFHIILGEHACFTQPQIWKVHKIASGWQMYKCTNSRCRKVINVGIECIVIEGALIVPFNTNKAVARKFYY